jgi:hypothetical protein
VKIPFKREQFLSAEEEQRRSSLKEAQRRLKDAEKAYESRVKDARKRLGEAEKDHERLLSEARLHLEAVERSQKLGKLAGVTLYDDRIETPDGNSVLSPEVRADADTAGNLAMSSRVTATRLVTLGVFAFAFKKKKKHDARELYLAIETSDFMCVRKLDPNLGSAARQFAAKIVNAGKQAPQLIEQRRRSVAEAKRKLDGVASDQRSIEAAKDALRNAEAGTAEVNRCRAEVQLLTIVPA